MKNELKFDLWNDGYVENKHLIKCPDCGIMFDKPKWHYCRCPMCDFSLWDDREDVI